MLPKWCCHNEFIYMDYIECECWQWGNIRNACNDILFESQANRAISENVNGFFDDGLCRRLDKTKTHRETIWFAAISGIILGSMSLWLWISIYSSFIFKQFIIFIVKSAWRNVSLRKWLFFKAIWFQDGIILAFFFVCASQIECQRRWLSIVL